MAYSTRMILFLLLVAVVSGQLPFFDVMNFTQPANVAEDPLKESKIVEIKITPGSDPIQSCSVGSIPNGPFNAVKKGGDANHWVYYDATSALSYKSASFYHLKVDCSDSATNTREILDLFLYVQPNSPPTINKYRIDSVPLDVKTVQPVPATVYTVTATDPENDVLTFSLTDQQPNTGLFTQDSQAPATIKTTKDLRTVTEPSFFLTVSVSDGKNTITDFKVRVTIENMNTPPAILNLPGAVTIREDALTGTSLYKLIIDDPTYGSSITSTCITSPSADSSKFPYNPSSSTFTLSGNDPILDFESREMYTITCSATDGFLSSSGPDILTIYVENVDEGLNFDSQDYNCQLTEGEPRKSCCTLQLTVTDKDNYPVDSIAFDTPPNSDNFYYDKDTKRVCIDVKYEVDNNMMSTSVDLRLIATNIAGTTASATVRITVSDANDKICQLDKEISFSQVDQFTALGQLDTFTGTDEDLTSPNNDVHIQVVSVNPPETRNYVSVSDAGIVSYTGAIPTAKSGSSYIMIIRCKDGTTPTKFSLATVIVSYTVLVTTTFSTNSTPTTTEADKDLWKYDWFVAVFSLLMLCLFAGLAGAVAFLAYKCCYQRLYNTFENSTNKVSPMREDSIGKRRSSYFDNDDYLTTRSSYIYARSWENSLVPSPRQLPSLDL